MTGGYDSSAGGAYSESSPFVKLFETPSRVKIVDVFLRKHYEELTASDVIELAGLSRNSFHRNVDDLEELGIVERAGTVGNTTTYRLNKDSELAKTLAAAHADVLRHSARVLETTDARIERSIEASVKQARGGNDKARDGDDADRDAFDRKVVDAIAG
ncbi:winged helix-turn-helix domain-containing protein [Natrarchaeobius oligotrophus]|uniref:ArsR family transcriptional regulator n=1 Tax=Natrarchaeobius chitinivorans TaxID=1679083 RepID=A0A3N6MG07_NATCH|nr:winged helix-turn-helix domain-containing protein [Natrarchaeobius chitinivorans]RQH01898.1 ArsR family transcriptional regulator [Natrarchaeobius chitinivorans]